MVTLKIFLKIFMVLLLLSSICSIKANALNSPSITLSTERDSIPVGEEFYIHVNGENLENLYTLTFSMKFTPYAVEILSIDPGEILKDEQIEFNSFSNSINEDSKMINFFETFTGSSKGKSPNGEILKIKAKLLRECKVPLKIINTNSDLSVGSPNMQIILIDNSLNKVNFENSTQYIQTNNFNTDDDIKLFINDVYKKTFLRESDEDGFNYWYDRLISYEYSVRNFLLNILNEKEFINKNLSNEEFITAMYSIVTNREPDEPGYNYWLNMLKEYQTNLSAKDAKSQIILRICNEAELSERANKINLKF